MLRTLTLTGSWAALDTVKAGAVDILNNSGNDLQIRHAHDSANSITLKNGQSARLGIPTLRAETVELYGTGDVALIYDLP